MKKSISRNYIYNVIYQVLILLVPLITTPYIARILTVDDIGIYSYTYSIVTFFVILAELGSAVYARREIAYCQNDKNKRSILFWEIIIIRVVTTVLSLCLYFFYVANSANLKIAIIQMLYIVAVSFDITCFFQGLEDFGTIVLKNSMIKILSMILIFIFVNSEDDLIIYVSILAILPLIGNIITWKEISKYVKKVSINELKPLKHLRGILILFIPTIASQVYLILDKTMLGFFTTDNIENGYYEQAQKIIKMCWTFLTTFATVMSPRIAYLYSQNDKKKLKEYMCDSFNFIWFLSSALAFGIIAIADNLIPWFLGSDYNKVIILLYIFSFILFPIGISGVIGSQYLVTIKKQRVYNISIIVGAVLNFSMNYFLIPRYYSIGVSISSVITEFIITIIQVIYVTCVLKDISLKDIFSNSWKYILSGIIMYICLRNISPYFDSTAIYTCLLIAIGALIYFLSLILLKDKLIFRGIKKYLLKKI